MKEATKSWLEYAKKDLIAAKELLENAEVANIVLFHSQQLVEKSLKAIFEENNIPIKKTHSINILLNLLPNQIQSKLEFDEDNIITIDEIYFNERYPSEFGILPTGFPSQKKAKEIFDIALRMHKNCLKVLG